MTMAQTASPARQTAEKNSMDANYLNHTRNASSDSIFRQLSCIVGALHNPRLRSTERACLLLCAGEILFDFLGQRLAGTATELKGIKHEQ